VPAVEMSHQFRHRRTRPTWAYASSSTTVPQKRWANWIPSASLLLIPCSICLISPVIGELRGDKSVIWFVQLGQKRWADWIPSTSLLLFPSSICLISSGIGELWGDKFVISTVWSEIALYYFGRLSIKIIISLKAACSIPHHPTRVCVDLWTWRDYWTIKKFLGWIGYRGYYVVDSSCIYLSASSSALFINLFFTCKSFFEPFICMLPSPVNGVLCHSLLPKPSVVCVDYSRS
jgi:hypothetical protein